MKKKFFILLTPILSINSSLFLMRSCHPEPYCTFPIEAAVTVADNSDSVQHAPSPAGVPAKGLLLELTAIDSTYSCQTWERSSLPNNAYAYSKQKEVVTIDSIAIFSDRDFDAQHPAGSNLRTLFFASDTSDIHKAGYTYRYHNVLYLLHAPSDTGTHTFTVLFLMSDPSRNMTAIAPPVKLLL